MSENNRSDSLKERKFFADRLSSVLFFVPMLLVSLTIGTIMWAMAIDSRLMGSWDACFAAWTVINTIILFPVFILSYPLYDLIDLSICTLVKSISNFENIPSFTESPKLNILLLMYGYRIRKFVSGGFITDLVVDDRIKQAHKKVEDVLSESAVIDVIKKGKSNHFKKDVVASVAEVIRSAIQEVGEISKNTKIENHNKVRKQNEESDQEIVEFLAREK